MIGFMRAKTSSQQGFTLTETIASLAILSILLVTVVGTITFGVNMQRQQREYANADMLSDVVRTNVRDIVHQASAATGDLIIISDTNDWIQFLVRNDTEYRRAGVYRLFVNQGKAWTAYMGASDVVNFSLTAGKQSFGLLPDSTYIDGLKVDLSFSKASTSDVENESTIYIDQIILTTTVRNASDEVISEVTEVINPLNKSADSSNALVVYASEVNR